MLLSKIVSKYSKNSHKSIVCVSTFQTPIGEVIAAADEEFLYNLSFESTKTYEKKFETLHKELNCKFVEKQNTLLLKFELELISYFKGVIKKIQVPIKMFGTDFQKAVWNKLQELPYASTLTYGDIAKSLGRPVSHSRAVGAACGANCQLIVIPCHRIIANGSIGGFNGDINHKEWLIAHEKKYSI